MHGGAVTLAGRVNACKMIPDIFLVSDMLDLNVFRSLLLPELRKIPVFIYFHENQFAYPDVSSSPDHHYRYINYLAALGADKIFFNSRYNRDSFLEGVQNLLQGFPDYRNMQTIHAIKKKSEILELGFSCNEYQQTKKENKVAHILWNHRWEHDKGPEEFFQALIQIKNRGIRFKLVVCGEVYKTSPQIFQTARKELTEEIVHFGFVKSRQEYLQLLAVADIIPVTSKQDFFGISVVEAVLSGAIPLLPKRLAYPEIFPVKKYNSCYYENLAEELEKKITDFSYPETDILRQDLIAHLQKYDWSRLKNKYNEKILS